MLGSFVFQIEQLFELYLFIRIHDYIADFSSSFFREQVNIFSCYGNSNLRNSEQAGSTAADVEIADWLRKNHSNKCIVLAVNKCESPKKGTIQALDFWSLGCAFVLSSLFCSFPSNK